MTVPQSSPPKVTVFDLVLRGLWVLVGGLVWVILAGKGELPPRSSRMTDTAAAGRARAEMRAALAGSARDATARRTTPLQLR